jgi:DNA processing protein
LSLKKILADDRGVCLTDFEILSCRFLQEAAVDKNKKEMHRAQLHYAVAASLIKKCRFEQRLAFYRAACSCGFPPDSSAAVMLGRCGFCISGLESILAEACRIVNLADMMEITIVCAAEAAYPPLLRECYDPPFVLYYRGSLDGLQIPPAAVVGTRYPDPAGRREAFESGRGLAECGVPVVSGLARGIDVLSHRGALDGGGYTAAVLAGGIDKIFPVENRAVARSILREGGALLSEYPPGTVVKRYMFPARNRIIAWISRGTLVVQAPRRSGALITAGFALDENRDVFVHGGCLGGSAGEGCRNLAEDGATVVADGREIAELWNTESKSRNFFLQNEMFGDLNSSRN